MNCTIDNSIANAYESSYVRCDTLKGFACLNMLVNLNFLDLWSCQIVKNLDISISG